MQDEVCQVVLGNWAIQINGFSGRISIFQGGLKGGLKGQMQLTKKRIPYQDNKTQPSDRIQHLTYINIYEKFGTTYISFKDEDNATYYGLVNKKLNMIFGHFHFGQNWQSSYTFNAMKIE